MKMEYKEFEDAVIDCLKKELETSSGGSATIEVMEHSNRTGVMFQFTDEAFKNEVYGTVSQGKHSMRVRTIAWLDNVYVCHDPITPDNIRPIALEIIGQLYDGLKLENDRDFVEDVEQLLDELPQSKEALLSRVEFIALNMEGNKDACSFAAYTEWNDLVLFYTILVQGTPTYVMQEHVEKFGITMEELHAAAVKNMTSRYETILMPLDEFLDSLKVSMDVEDDVEFPPEMKDGMPYVCSLKDRPFSASAFFLPGVAKRCQELVGDTFYVYVCSVHEVIIQPVNYSEPLMQAEFVEDMNARLPVKDRLTNQVYFYNGSEFECVYDNPAPIF